MPTPSPPHAEPAPEAVDGRRARRERGRLAVINATIDLVFEGHTPPTAEEVAQRAGVSVASIFRYFETLDELRECATERYFERFAPIFEVPDIGVGDLDHRIAVFVGARVGQHEATSPMARLMRSRALEVPQLHATLHRVRGMQSDQIRLHFEPEFRGRKPATRDDVVAIVSTITSFESWDQFRHDHERSPAQTRRAWTNALHRILKAA